MKQDRITPHWGAFWHAAYPRLHPGQISLDELRRLEEAARYWLADVRRTLAAREATHGRKRA